MWKDNLKKALSPLKLMTEVLNIAIAVDTSGSIHLEKIDGVMSEVMSELRSRINSYAMSNVNIWCFDTMIYNHQTSIDGFTLKGGGGSNPDINFKFIKENNIKPKALVIVTDGYFDNIHEKCNPDINVIWVLIDRNKNFKPPFGIVIRAV